MKPALAELDVEVYFAMLYFKIDGILRYIIYLYYVVRACTFRNASAK